MTQRFYAPRKGSLGHPLVVALAVALTVGLGGASAAAAPAADEPPPGVHSADQGEVTLNFRDMDINALIEAVSKVTGKNFIVDPRVKARVTVISAHPMSPQKLYDVFLSILQVNGFAAVTVGNVIKIVPEVNARSDAQPVNPGPSTESDQMVTEVVRLRYVPAAPLLTVLRQIMPQQAALSVYPDANALVITDRAGNIGRLKKILAQVDQPAVGDVEVIRLKRASAESVVATLKALFGASGLMAHAAAGGAAGGGNAANNISSVPAFAADDRTNSVLLSGDAVARARMRAVILNLDTPERSFGNTRVFRLQYANAEDLVKVLKGLAAQTGTTTPTGKAGAGTTAAVLGGQVDVTADKSLNALVVTASPSRMESIESVIHQLDVRRQQVLVEAIIAEVSNGLTKKIGTQFLVGGHNGTVPIGISTFNGLLSSVASSAAQAGTGGTANALGLGLASSLGDGGNVGVGRYGQGGTDFALLVSALSGDAGNNILSTPSLLTLDNQEASIVVGQNIPIVTGSYAQTGSATSPTNPFQTITREDIGVKLKVTPTISPDGTVRLKIEQEVSSLDTTAQTTAGLITNKRNVTTTVQVDDGDVVVLGGLIDDSSNSNQQSVPGLGDIPVIGNLFRYRTASSTKRNLMVFIRPLIIDANGKLAKFSQAQYARIRQSQRDIYDSRSLIDPKDWAVLPPEHSFQRNLPIPLPENIQQLMEQDRVREATLRGAATTVSQSARAQ
ncbi:type II secretion system protein GspD [Halothiobacillus diazotrophicus]|uniref:Type II secretion system protein GspD n=1 Tax=Halothiobacillus diazotrophicus TaxID=1860122 RepID=A0A191ZHS1_9GAMM|nr:type II secretion system secretin GspD [Halothiobacillus diazotrophicus]ANJ67429.1 type II secretion system protein GspD [Halothiobacillus diazotrophicus]